MKWLARYLNENSPTLKSLKVAALEPRRSLILHGGIPIGNSPPPYDFT